MQACASRAVGLVPASRFLEDALDIGFGADSRAPKIRLLRMAASAGASAHRLTMLDQCLVEPAGVLQRVGEIASRMRVAGLQAQRVAIGLGRGIELAQRGQRVAEIVVRLRIVEVERERLAIAGRRRRRDRRPPASALPRL